MEANPSHRVGPDGGSAFIQAMRAKAQAIVDYYAQFEERGPDISAMSDDEVALWLGEPCVR